MIRCADVARIYRRNLTMYRPLQKRKEVEPVPPMAWVPTSLDILRRRITKLYLINLITTKDGNF